MLCIDVKGVVVYILSGLIVCESAFGRSRWTAVCF